MEMGELCGVDMINVCFFSGDITRSGGTERVATVIANELQKNNEYRVSFVSMWENGDKPFFYVDASIKRFTLYGKEKKGFYHLLGYIHRLRRVVKKNNIDILIDVDGILDMYSIPALIGLKTKLISWEHFGYLSNPFVSYRKITRRMAARWADAIVVITNKDKEIYNNNLKIRGLIKTIYNPILLKRTLQEYDINSKQIISVGRLSYDKGYDMLVDIAEQVLKKNSDWGWIIVGEGEERANIERVIKEKQLGSQLKLIGRKNNLEKYYLESSILVATSRYEGFGLMIAEAKSFGIPCVSFDCPVGPAEIIDDGENGYLIDCFDNKKMAEKVNYLINNEDLRKEMSEKSANGMDKFFVDNIMTLWKDLIQRLVNEE